MDKPKKAFLVTVYQDPSQKLSAEEHLAELSFLAETFDLEPVGAMICFIRKTESSTFITKGKVEEVLEEALKVGADLIIFDDEITPSQQRNLEAIFKMPVMDRTELIIGVFGKRALTKEAKIQVELARVRYEAPRLKRLWTHLSRQLGSAGGGASGGGGYLKGEGEKQIEIDRRILKRKIDALQNDLKEVAHQRGVERTSRKRNNISSFAIIGYTNAGKSTLLNALTDAGVLAENKLFATLDPTTRKFTLPSGHEVLLIDTVGFIRKLPHLLVAAFKSTLEECAYADFLLHLVDMSNKEALEHAETTFQVLKELNAENLPIIHLLNKVDLIQDDPEGKARILKYKLKIPNCIEISALNKTGFDLLLEKMEGEIRKKRKVITLKIPQSEYQVAAEVIASGFLLSKEYEENEIILTAELPDSLAGKFKQYIVTS